MFPACGNGRNHVAVVGWLGTAVAGHETIIISMVTLAVTVFGSVLFRGFTASFRFCVGVLAGYALVIRAGVVDTADCPSTGLRFRLYTPRFEWFAI